MNYFDLHCDTISECYGQRLKLKNSELQLSLEKGKAIDKWVQVYAIWMDDVLRGEKAYTHFNNVYDYFLGQIKANEQELRFVTSSHEMRKVIEEGKHGAVLAIEGSGALGGKIEHVREVYEKGVRMMTLTWNGTCEVGDGCMVDCAGGLTAFGKQVVYEMNQLGMIVDVSHLSEQGFWDVTALMEGAIVATHSNSKAICDVPRNLTDKQFNVFVERGGIVGMNFYPLFINGTLEAKVEELIPHIDHFLELGGENVIAMGSDFDGAKMPQDLSGIDEISQLYNKLVARYGIEKADKFFYENAYSFMAKHLG